MILQTERYEWKVDYCSLLSEYLGVFLHVVSQFLHHLCWSFLIYSILIFEVLSLSVKCNVAGWDAENKHTHVNRTPSTSNTFISVCYKFGFFGFSFQSHVVRTPSSSSVFASAQKPLVTVGHVSCFDPQSRVLAARNGENPPNVSWKQWCGDTCWTARQPSCRWWGRFLLQLQLGSFQGGNSLDREDCSRISSDNTWSNLTLISGLI